MELCSVRDVSNVSQSVWDRSAPRQAGGADGLPKQTR
jgi:hypothetical protein